MGFQALLSDGNVIAPAVEVLSRRMTAREADDAYRGTAGICPDCLRRRLGLREIDNAHIQRALLEADLTVKYRSAAYDQGRMTRIMHFAHRAGFLKGDDLSQGCSCPNMAYHAAAVQVLGRWAQDEWPMATVEAGMTIVEPGTPPQQYRPDVSVLDFMGRPVACIEYQRTAEGFGEFMQRHELRCRQFPIVRWFFAGGAYLKSRDHRIYLNEHGHTFYRCWVDPDNGALVAEEGKAPLGAKRPRSQTRGLAECSEASLIRALEQREEQKPVRPAAQIDANRPLRMMDAPVAVSSPAVRSADAAHARERERVAMVERKPLGGMAIAVDGHPGWVLTGGLPRAHLTDIACACVSPSGEHQMITRGRITTV